MIWIPAFPIHRDANIYPNPDDFNPENFTEDAINNRHPMNYLAFSNGPRNCIGTFYSISNSNLLYIRFKNKKKIILKILFIKKKFYYIFTKFQPLNSEKMSSK